MERQRRCQVPRAEQTSKLPGLCGEDMVTAMHRYIQGLLRKASVGSRGLMSGTGSEWAARQNGRWLRGAVGRPDPEVLECRTWKLNSHGKELVNQHSTTRLLLRRRAPHPCVNGSTTQAHPALAWMLPVSGSCLGAICSFVSNGKHLCIVDILPQGNRMSTNGSNS